MLFIRETKWNGDTLEYKIKNQISKIKMKDQKSKIIKSEIIFATLLIFLGVLFRTSWRLGPNVEFVTSAALLAGAYLGKKWAVFIPLSIMAISDLLLGNTNIFLFTWSAYLFIGYLGNLGHLDNLKIKTKILHATGLGVIASIWFFLWTNFGVWLLDSWGMYPKTLSGLIDAYIMGLPFLKYNLIGNLILVPSSFACMEILSVKFQFRAKKIFNF